MSFRALIIVVLGATHSSAFAQQPNPPSPTTPSPSIVLVVPTNGAPIPADKPVVLLRFAGGDSTDAIDRSSVRMSVDGQDRTSLLQFDDGQAWGRIAPDSSGMIAPGVHLLHVRVCSMRGVCGMLDAPVKVAPVEPVVQAGASEPDSTAQRGSSVSLIRMLLELVLALARKLIGP